MRIDRFMKSLLLPALVVLTPVYAQAVGNIHFGATEVHPSLGVSYRHDDNIYLNDGTIVKEVDDNIMIYKPALEIKNKKEEKTFLLRYRADIFRYSDRDSENRTDHRLTGLIDLKLPSGLILKLRDDYIDTADPASSEFTDLDKRTQNTLAADVGYYVLDRMALIARYKGTNHDYDEAALDNQDRDETTVGGELLIDLLPKTSFFVTYENESIEYDKIVGGDDRDSDTDRLLAGVRGQVTSKVTVNAAAGYEKRDYRAAAKEDFSTSIIKLRVTQAYSETTRLSLSGHRKNVESFYLTNNFFTENMLSLNFDYQFNHKIGTNVRAFYGTNEYNRTTREDDLTGYALDVTYAIQPWLTFTAGYAYKERDSNVNAEDYTNNQYFATLKATL